MASSSNTVKKDIIDLIFGKRPHEKDVKHAAQMFQVLVNYVTTQPNSNFMHPNPGCALKKQDWENAKAAIGRLDQDVAQLVLNHLSTHPALDNDDDGPIPGAAAGNPANTVKWDKLVTVISDGTSTPPLPAAGNTASWEHVVPTSTGPKADTPSKPSQKKDASSMKTPPPLAVQTNMDEELAAASRNILRRHLAAQLGDLNAAMTQREAAIARHQAKSLRDRQEAMQELSSVMADLEKVTLVEGVESRNLLSFFPWS
jgi:hypothetical protein